MSESHHDFNDVFNVIELDDICKNEFTHRLCYFCISESDIEKLREGKILYSMTKEHGIFLTLEKNELRAINKCKNCVHKWISDAHSYVDSSLP